MIYRVKKGNAYHNKLLAFIGESDKWAIAFQKLDDIFEMKVTEIGIYPTLNEKLSFKINKDNVPEDKKKYFDKSGWLLPNNKYYKQWKQLVDVLDLHSTEKNYENQFKLGIFKNPQVYVDTPNFDLLIKVDEVTPLNSSNEKEHKILKEEFELTSLIDFPI